MNYSTKCSDHFIFLVNEHNFGALKYSNSSLKTIRESGSWFQSAESVPQ